MRSFFVQLNELQKNAAEWCWHIDIFVLCPLRFCSWMPEWCFKHYAFCLTGEWRRRIGHVLWNRITLLWMGPLNEILLGALNGLRITLYECWVCVMYQVPYISAEVPKLYCTIQVFGPYSVLRIYIKRTSSIPLHTSDKNQEIYASTFCRWDASLSIGSRESVGSVLPHCKGTVHTTLDSYSHTNFLVWLLKSYLLDMHKRIYTAIRTYLFTEPRHLIIYGACTAHE